MALYANQKRQTQQGLYPGSGVAQGGNVGRTASLHMGMPSAKIGGTVGKTATPLKPLKPLTPIGGRPIGNTAKPVVAKPAPLPAIPTLGSLSTHDPRYLQSIAQANYDYNMAGAPITDLRSQLISNAPRYTLGLTDTNKANQLGADQSNADFASRGIFQSGGRIGADVQRKDAYDKALADLSDQYGPAAAARIQGQITAAESARVGGRDMAVQSAEQTAYQDAMDRLSQSPPSAPVRATSTTQPQSPGVQRYAPHGWKPGIAGQFYSGGTWHWINAAGEIAHGIQQQPHARTF